MTMLDIFRGLKGLTKSQSVMASKAGEVGEVEKFLFRSQSTAQYFGCTTLQQSPSFSPSPSSSPLDSELLSPHIRTDLINSSGTSETP